MASASPSSGAGSAPISSMSLGERASTSSRCAFAAACFFLLFCTLRCRACETTPPAPCPPHFWDVRLMVQPSDKLECLHQRSRSFFVHDGRLWRHHAQGHHQLALMHPQQRLQVTREVHDKLGHKGFYSTLRALRGRFWWSSLANDVRWYIKTCH